VSLEKAYNRKKEQQKFIKEIKYAVQE